VTTLSPAVAVYSCGSSNSYGHPGQNVLDNFFNEGTQQYFTQPCDPTRNYYDAIFANGNVEIKTGDGVTYTVNGDPYVAIDPSGSSGNPRPPAVGEVLLNEFLPAPQTLFTTEWVELFNLTGDWLDIGGMWIDDLLGGGSAPRQIPAGALLAPGGFYVLEFSNFLNNTGDDVHLLGTNGTTIFDSFTYGSTSYDLSYCRQPDGGAWAAGYCTATMGQPN
jgi:hypothetical protein